MGKAKNVYVCRECGRREARWVGRCPACGEWGSLDEELARDEGAAPSRRRPSTAARAQPIGSVSGENIQRISTGAPELDRVLGGGVSPGSVVLLGGEPGIGKSTLLLQSAGGMAAAGLKVLYVSAEESASQLRLRADRLGAINDRLLVLAENDLSAILAAAEEEDAGAVAVDSIQMIFWSELGSAPGTVAQVRECAAALAAQAKRRQAPLFLIGHVTKDGAIAGPKVLEHMVDVVLSFEGDRQHAARLLRSTKNRYGRADEVGVMEMAEDGLRPVRDPSRLFLGNWRDRPGSVAAAPLSGTRPLLVEVQALVAPTYPGAAMRRVSGADANRVAMILAVLEKHGGLSLRDQDIFVNVVAGLEARDPGADLALALAIAGSFLDRTFPADALAVGEIGLGGEIRPAGQLGLRLSEAARLGFKRAAVPEKPAKPPQGMEITVVRTIQEALSWLGQN